MIKKADDGEEARFLELYGATCEPLRRYVHRVLGDASRIDDIVQESYLRAMASAGLPVESQQARAYLFRIASNLMRDRWRRLRREAPADAGVIASSITNDVGLRMDLAKVFKSLALRERQLIWLAYVEGFDHGAIAVALGLRTPSIKVLLHRAREKLAVLLREGGYDQP